MIVLLAAILAGCALAGPTGTSPSGFAWNRTVAYPNDRTGTERDRVGGIVRAQDHVVVLVGTSTEGTSTPIEIESSDGTLLEIAPGNTETVARLLYLDPDTGALKGVTGLLSPSGDISGIAPKSLVQDKAHGLVVATLEFRVEVGGAASVDLTATTWEAGTTPPTVAGGQSSISLTPSTLQGIATMIIGVNALDGSLAYATIGPATDTAVEQARCPGAAAMPGAGVLALACTTHGGPDEALDIYNSDFTSADGSNLPTEVTGAAVPKLEQPSVSIVAYNLSNGLPLGFVTINEADAATYGSTAADLSIEYMSMAAAEDGTDLYLMVRYSASMDGEHNATLGQDSDGNDVLLRSLGQAASGRPSDAAQGALLRFRVPGGTSSPPTIEQVLHLSPSSGLPSMMPSYAAVGVSTMGQGGRVAVCGAAIGASFDWSGLDSGSGYYERTRQSGSGDIKGFGFMSVVTRGSMEVQGTGLWDGVEDVAGSAVEEGCMALQWMPTGGFTAVVRLLGQTVNGITNVTRSLTQTGSAGQLGSNSAPVSAATGFNPDLLAVRYAHDLSLASAEVMGRPEGDSGYYTYIVDAMDVGASIGVEGGDTVFVGLSHDGPLQFGSNPTRAVVQGPFATSYTYSTIIRMSSLGNTGVGGDGTGSVSLQSTAALVFGPTPLDSSFRGISSGKQGAAIGGRGVGEIYEPDGLPGGEFEGFKIFGGTPAGGRGSDAYGGIDEMCRDAAEVFGLTTDGTLVVLETSAPQEAGTVRFCFEATNRTAVRVAEALAPVRGHGASLHTSEVFVVEAQLACNVEVAGVVPRASTPDVPESITVTQLPSQQQYVSQEVVQQEIRVVVRGVDRGEPMFGAANPLMMDSAQITDSIRMRVWPEGGADSVTSAALVHVSVDEIELAQVPAAEGEGTETVVRATVRLSAPRAPRPLQVDGTTIDPSFSWTPDHSDITIDVGDLLDEAVQVGVVEQAVHQFISRRIARDVVRAAGRPVDWYTARSCEILSGIVQRAEPAVVVPGE